MNNNQLAPRVNINKYLEAPAVVARLSEKLGLEEAKMFKAALSSAISTNKKLLECTPESIIGAALIGHSLKLPPSPQLGYYFMVPYKNKGVKEANFQIGYKGYIQLAMRSGSYRKLNVTTVKEGEFVAWNSLTEAFQAEFMEDPIEREGAKTIGYCGYFEYTNGFSKTVYWTRQAIETHADKYSQAYSLASDKLLKAGKIPQKEMWKYSIFWYKDFDVMALKTVIRNMLSRWGIMSVEMVRAYDMDTKSDYVPFDQAQLNAQDTINKEAGSQEVNGNFEYENQDERHEQNGDEVDGIDESFMNEQQPEG